MYQKYCEEKSIDSLLNKESLSLIFSGKPSTCTCACEKSLHGTTLSGWDNSCCNPLLTCAFIHSSNHELHIQQYRETHKHYGNRLNYLTTAQLPMSTWNCSIPTTVKPRLLMMSGNMKTSSANRSFPTKEKTKVHPPGSLLAHKLNTVSPYL